MELTITINLIVCICATIGFIMGVHAYFKQHQPLYAQMTTIALGCASLGRLYNVAVIVCDGDIPHTFNIGILAVVGCFLFFFSANHNQIDSLCDMTNPKNAKFKYIALIAPAIQAIVAGIVFFASDGKLALRISYLAEFLSIMLASYYNCKHLLIHDTDSGFIDSVRGYNLLVLITGFLYTSEITCDAFEVVIPKSFIYALMSICLLSIIPVLKRGVKKWTTI
ncbi:MAG: hypothetical protein IKP69_07270 [Oscillospiraceae bacterium]|nr:hypothetical protein [Oscillospiraceae bacterium]